MYKDITNEEIIDRKKFLKSAGSTALFTFLGIGFASCSSSTSSYDDNVVEGTPSNGGNGIDISGGGNTITIDLTKNDVSALRSSGGWLLVGGGNTLVVNVDGTIIRAFTSVCTHQSCSDSWTFSNQLFECTCHGSRFNTDGAVVRGPASRDLDEFNVTRDGDIVTINK